ncbi:MAG: glutamate-5-semialdehyde dehydrogenase [Clostridia bacterium]|nr:glutamate-5-semialdehyde dehydrogenase [Clostridia bacterium]
MKKMLQAAKTAKRQAASLSEADKNRCLCAIADAIRANKSHILAQNKLDVEAAASKLSPVMIDRLRLTEERIDGLVQGILDVTSLPDPCGRLLEETTRPNGLKIQRVSTPIGVIEVIYESRPNVTSDVAALCLKSGNVCVLRGGKEAFRSSCAIVDAMKDGLRQAGFSENLVNIVTDTSRESATALMTANDYVDVLIPRGGKNLIASCVQNATVPCIQTGTGICHVYVDASADPDMALSIIDNAKTSRPSVCNAEEVLLVHESIAAAFLPRLKARLVDARIEKGLSPVELRLDKRAAAIIDGTPAGEADFDTEFLDYILAVAVLDNVQEAIDHIALHSTGHSEAIVTSDSAAAEAFTKQVDSAAVYVNASTRFTDGGEFGLGCEIGISTQKLHARGPMGLRELTTYKYVVTGNGQVR